MRPVVVATYPSFGATAATGETTITLTQMSHYVWVEQELENLHLLGFESRLVQHGARVQHERLQRESPQTSDTNDKQAVALGIIGCRSMWGLIALPFVVIALVLQLTVGVWCLIAWAAVGGCVIMNFWRGVQSRRLLKQIGLETSTRRIVRQQIRQARGR